MTKFKALKSSHRQVPQSIAPLYSKRMNIIKPNHLKPKTFVLIND